MSDLRQLRIPRAPLFIALAGMLLCVLGWALFWFLTDDAFIAFRYVSNRQLGHGYVWNAAPWLPVEGYTSFLWIVLLDLVWTLSGVAPPDAANVLSLLFSLATVALFVRAAWRLTEHDGRKGRVFLLALAVLGLTTQRVFLTWTSSGLETALFNFLLFAWGYAAFRLSAGAPRYRWALSGLAAALALTRPDGYLFVAATLAIYGLAWLQHKVRLVRVARFASPLLLVLAHLLWRRAFYGEWLPNTYYAKSVDPLPDLGLRFLAMFVVEHALWLWLLLATAAFSRARAWRGFGTRLPAALAVLAVLAHVTFYTVITGGDHFEYRVLSHLVPPFVLLLLWSALRLFRSPGLAAGAIVVVLGLSAVLPWMQWRANLAQGEWVPELRLFPIAEHLPGPLQPYGRLYDALEEANAEHFVAMRHQHHKLFGDHQMAWVPPREQGAQLFAGVENPVVLTTGAGVTGWRFPSAHILDYYGLNDYVVARTRPLAPNVRIVAHARRPPPGYVEAFRPNVTVTPTSISELRTRRVPLHDADIEAIEARFRAALPEDRNEPIPVE